MTRTSKARINITQIRNGQIKHKIKQDVVVTEEPLEIRLMAGSDTQQLAVTMRTPGAGFELATGFLYSEGIIESREDITHISYCVDRDLSEEQRYNVVNVRLRQNELPALDHLERHFFTTSACGVCGKKSIEALETRGLRPISSDLNMSIDTISQITDKLRSAQSLFDNTGGLHAVGLFDKHGDLIIAREDVGRHNAMDKVIGWAVQQNQLPLNEIIVLVSGRASFELVQKALAVQIPIFCAVSAPSSLAIDLAYRFDMTLIGFLRENNFNIYTSPNRIQSQ
jgi:FdhD protein